MTASARIPATIVTGFLGAGKTTLIRHLIERADGRRIALMVNEFGEMGFDGALLGDCGVPGCTADEIVELTNGCICCTVADDFLPAMEALIARDPAPDHIVIETSGLALPQPLVRAFAWPDIRHRVTVDAVVVVADATAIAEGRTVPETPDAIRAAAAIPDHDDPIEELFHDQLRSADMIVLTKTDLIDAATAAVAEARLGTAARPQTAILRTGGEGLPADVLLGLGAAAEDDLTERWSQHEQEEGEHDHDDFDSFVAAVNPFASLDAVKASVGSVLAMPGVLRVKGHVRIADRPAPAVVQGVGSRVEAWFGAGERASGLVVIGLSDIDRAAIERALGA